MRRFITYRIDGYPTHVMKVTCKLPGIETRTLTISGSSPTEMLSKVRAYFKERAPCLLKTDYHGEVIEYE